MGLAEYLSKEAASLVGLNRDTHTWIIRKKVRVGKTNKRRDYLVYYKGFPSDNGPSKHLVILECNGGRDEESGRLYFRTFSLNCPPGTVENDRLVAFFEELGMTVDSAYRVSRRVLERRVLKAVESLVD